MGLDFTPKGGPDIQVDASFGDVTELTKTIDIKTNKELMAALADHGVTPKVEEVKAEVVPEEKPGEVKTEEVVEDKAPEAEEVPTEEVVVDEPKTEPVATEPEVKPTEEKVVEPAKTVESKLELDQAYRSLEDKGLLESQYSITEVYKLRGQLEKMVPPAKPADYDDLPMDDKLDYREKVRDFNAEVKQLQKEIVYNNDRIKNIYDIRLNKFMEKLPSQETAQQFSNWLAKDTLGRARLSSSAMGAETIEEVYETFVKRQNKAKQRTEDKTQLQKPVAPKFQTEKKTPVQAAKKTVASSKFTRLSDPRNAENVKQIKMMWGITRPGQKMTEEALESILENAERVG